MYKKTLDILLKVSYYKQAVANEANAKRTEKEFEKIQKKSLTNSFECDIIIWLCDERNQPGVQRPRTL